MRRTLEEVRSAIAAMVASYRAARLVHDGINLVIAGPPNAGKSSLFNRILRESRAIVSEIPGTTRDVISGNVVIDGRHWVLHDTAGIRSDTDDRIEALGIERTIGMAATADVVVWCDDEQPQAGESTALRDCLRHLAGAHRLCISDKADRSPSCSPGLFSKRQSNKRPILRNARTPLRVSAVSGEGLDAFLPSSEKLPTGLRRWRVSPR